MVSIIDAVKVKMFNVFGNISWWHEFIIFVQNIGQIGYCDLY